MKSPLIAALCLLGAAPSATPQANVSVPSRSEEVLVDVVVRDKHGRASTDLSQSDFSVYDNGESRPIKSFRLITGKDAVTASTTPGQLNPGRQIRLMTFIFDKMDVSGMRLSRQAALELLNQDLPPNVYAGVFLLDTKLNAVQGFTSQRDLLRNAIEKATSGSNSLIASESGNLRAAAEEIIGPNQAGKQSLEQRVLQMGGSDVNGNPVAPDGRTNGFAEADYAMAQMLVQMIDFSERSEMVSTGRSSIAALLAAVRAESHLPGRKSVLYFSNGFSVPQGMEDTFRQVISAANQSNVSFYPFDAHGLDTTNLNDRSTDKLDEATFSSRDAITNGASANLHRASTAARSQDTAIESGRYNTQDTLAMLADDTGGFLTANTNDFRGPAQRIAEETATYYEISYDPHITRYDGAFRKIEVKTSRADLRVQSRSGYFALPASMTQGGSMPDGYEFSLLRALSTTPFPEAFPFESGGMHFRGDEHNELCGFLINVPLQNVTVRDNAKGGFEGGLSYVALVKDFDGAVVKKLQGEMPVKLTADQIPGFHQTQFTDAEYFDVPPGHYTIETAVLDRESGKTSVHRTALLVPKQGETLAMSSVALVRSWHGKEPDAAADDPFVVGDKAVVPTLLPKFNKSVSDSLPFYAVLYPDPKNAAKPEVTVEFIRDGKLRQVGKPEVSAPDAQGRIQLVANTPIEKLVPGNYAIRVRVRQGNEMAEEQFALVLEP